jgi:hypothetical protein
MAPRKKAIERAELKEVREVTLTLQASEEFLQRLAALLIFAPHVEVKAKPLPPLPWEDPKDPRYELPPQLEVDYNAVRNSIMAHLEAYVPLHGKDAALALIKSHGGTRLGDVPEDRLVALDAAFSGALGANA